MGKFFRSVALAAAAIITVALAQPAAAKPKHWDGHKYGDARWHGPGPGGWYSGGSFGPPGWSGYHGPRRGWYGDDRPPGWDRGRKRGWGGHSMPPGLQKKHFR